MVKRHDKTRLWVPGDFGASKYIVGLFHGFSSRHNVPCPRQVIALGIAQPDNTCRNASDDSLRRRRASIERIKRIGVIDALGVSHGVVERQPIGNGIGFDGLHGPTNDIEALYRSSTFF